MAEADSTHDEPLLDDSDTTDDDDSNSTLDSRIEECIGELSCRQLLQAFLISLAWAFDAQQCFITIFTDASTPTTTYTTTTTSFHLSSSSTSPFIKGLPSSAFFLGCTVGGFLLSTLADSTLGRKNLLLLSSITMSFSSFLSAFSPNILIYSLLRFLCGFGRASIGTCSLVLSTELVGKKYRGQVGILGFVLFSLGFLSLPGIAYLNRDGSWRDMYLWTSAPVFIYCIIVRFFIHESPRWLLVRGRKEEAVMTLKSISAANRNSIITMSFFGASLLETTTRSTSGTYNCSDDHHNVVDMYSALKILLSRKWSFTRLLSISIIMFGIGMVYYGMPQGLENLPFNLYLSVSLNALSELPSSLITFFLIGKMNRRDCLLAACTVSGICSFLVPVVERTSGKCYYSAVAQVGLELVSFSSGIMALSVALLFTTELFPTCVRNTAIAIARQALVLGGACGPVLVAAGKGNGFLTYGVFGVVVAVCGLFTVCLPETRGVGMCDTMDEEEYKSLETAVVVAVV